MFLDPRGDGEDIWIEDDVLGPKIQLVDENTIGARADFHLAVFRVGLALLVERHDDHRGAITAHQTRLLDKRRLAFLETDRIDDTFALDAFEPGLDHRPFGRIDHHRDAADFGLGRDQIEKPDHRGFGIQQPFIHVDIDDLRAVLNLLQRHRERLLEIALLDQLREPQRAGHICPFSDIHKQRLRSNIIGFEPSQPERHGRLRQDPGRHSINRCSNGADMIRIRAAATADNIQKARPGEFTKCFPPSSPAFHRTHQTRSADPHWDGMTHLCRRCATAPRYRAAIPPDPAHS